MIYQEISPERLRIPPRSAPLNDPSTEEFVVHEHVEEAEGDGVVLIDAYYTIRHDVRNLEELP